MMVIETTGKAEAPQDILHPGSRALFRYWETIRGERAAPGREEIDLKAIRDYVPWLMILERNPVRQNYKWRLAGTKVCQLWRTELTGLDALLGWNRFEKETVLRLFDGVTGLLQPCAVRLRLLTALNQTIGAEIIALPVMSRKSAAIQVFGAVMPFRNVETLGYDRISGIELSSARMIWTEPLPGDALAAGASTRPLGRQFAPFELIAGGRRA